MCQKHQNHNFHRIGSFKSLIGHKMEEEGLKKVIKIHKTDRGSSVNNLIPKIIWFQKIKTSKDK